MNKSHDSNRIFERPEGRKRHHADNRNIPPGFARARKRRPCPVCGKADWCLVGLTDGGHVVSALCQRVASPNRWKEAGFLHRLDGTRRLPRPTRREVAEGSRPRLADAQLDALERRYRADVNPDALRRLAATLGLLPTTLGDYGIGWDHGARLWTFPMCDADHRLVGFRTRSWHGGKWCLPGSRNGLFIPDGAEGFLDARPGWRVHWPEGPTSAGALWELGHLAIGRANNNGKVDLVCAFARRFPGRHHVVWGDNDRAERVDPATGKVVVMRPGREGADKVAAALVALGPDVVRSVRVVIPSGHKDVRDWKNNGSLTGAGVDVLVACQRDRLGRGG